MEPAVSIIMPVYGVEDYVGRTIESILSQDFSDWELWCVDDGSRDRSGVICDEYAARDPRIRVVHKENGGAAAARNVAIRQARGRWFWFVDSDDWAEPEMLSSLVGPGEAADAELVVGGFHIDTYGKGDEPFTQRQSLPSRTYATQAEFRRDAHRLFDKNLLYPPWNKLFRADYLRHHGILFPDTFWDDLPFNLAVLRDVERVVLVEAAHYHFLRKRGESETARYRPEAHERRREEHRWMCELFRHWGIDTPEAREFLARRHVERLLGCVENVCTPACPLRGKARYEAVKAIVLSEEVAPAMALARPRSKRLKFLLFPFRHRLPRLALWEGQVISFIRRHDTTFFARAKAHR